MPSDGKREEMEVAISKTLQQEVDNVLQQAARHRGELQRRAAVLSDRIRCRQVCARAETLTPAFRAELLRRGKAIQKNRSRLLQTLRRYANVLSNGDLHDLLCSKNVEVVLCAIRETLQVEEQLANWQQPLPRVEAWHEVCLAISESCSRGGVSPRSPMESAQQLEVALERLLLSHDVWSHEKANATPWISFPCFCTLSQYCRQTQLKEVAPAAGTAAALRGNVNTSSNTQSDNNNNNLTRRRKMKINDCDSNSGDENEEAVVDSVSEMARIVLDAVAIQFDHLGRQLNGRDDDDDDEEEEEAMEEARLRLSIEIAARVTACTYAVTSLAAGEDGVLFDGIVSGTTAGGFGVKVVMEGLPTLPTISISTLVLPPMEQLFYCMAYTIGAAILRDEWSERNVGNTTIIVDDDNEKGNGSNSNKNGSSCGSDAVVDVNDDDDDDDDENRTGWRDLLERWMLRERGSSSAIMGPRLLQYLLVYVFYPATHGSPSSPAGAVALPLETARRWLALAFDGTSEGEAGIDAMMTLFTGRK